MYLICEICFTALGCIEEHACHPITGRMFTSKNPTRQIPAPFPDAAEWEHMRCRQCSRRPIIKPQRLLVEHPRCFETVGKGPTYFDLPASPNINDDDDYNCPYCGKYYRKYSSYKRFHKCPEAFKGETVNVAERPIQRAGDTTA